MRPKIVLIFESVKKSHIKLKESYFIYGQNKIKFNIFLNNPQKLFDLFLKADSIGIVLLQKSKIILSPKALKEKLV